MLMRNLEESNTKLVFKVKRSEEFEVYKLNPIVIVTFLDDERRR